MDRIEMMAANIGKTPTAYGWKENNWNEVAEKVGKLAPKVRSYMNRLVAEMRKAYSGINPKVSEVVVTHYPPYVVVQQSMRGESDVKATVTVRVGMEAYKLYDYGSEFGLREGVWTQVVTQGTRSSSQEGKLSGTSLPPTRKVVDMLLESVGDEATLIRMYGGRPFEKEDATVPTVDEVERFVVGKAKIRPYSVSRDEKGVLATWRSSSYYPGDTDPRPDHEHVKEAERLASEVMRHFGGNVVDAGLDTVWEKVYLEVKIVGGRQASDNKIASELLRIAEELVAVKFDTRKELQKYKTEHHPEPGTRMQLRTKQEMHKRYLERK